MDNIQKEIENKIIDLIALGARGRLIVFKPENSLGHSSQPSAYERGPADEADNDLIVEKRGNYKKKIISLKVCRKESPGDQGFEKEIYQFVDKKYFNTGENFYLVFVYFDIVKQDINDSFWVIPFLDLSRLFRQGRNNRGSTIESGQKLAKESFGTRRVPPRGKNDFSKFLINKKDFVRFLIEKLEDNKYKK